jgi:uncharacterized protein YjeT (DUF2065 family)
MSVGGGLVFAGLVTRTWMQANNRNVQLERFSSIFPGVAVGLMLVPEGMDIAASPQYTKTLFHESSNPLPHS